MQGERHPSALHRFGVTVALAWPGSVAARVDEVTRDSGCWDHYTAIKRWCKWIVMGLRVTRFVDRFDDRDGGRSGDAEICVPNVAAITPHDAGVRDRACSPCILMAAAPSRHPLATHRTHHHLHARPREHLDQRVT
jgi:hypothetical protein